MAQLTSTIYSEKLERYVSFTALIPTVGELKTFGAKGNKLSKPPYKTLYLLHGWTGNHLDWLMMSDVYAFSRKYQIAIILPSGENSFYVDHPSGAAYGEYIGEELIEITRELFPLSTEREDTWIAGLSMGGYGALRNGLYYSERFSKIAALSSAILSDKDESAHKQLGSSPIELAIQAAMGIERLAELPRKNNPYDLAANRQENQAVYLACGLEDDLLEKNRAYHKFLKEQNISHVYKETPGGHEWDFWNTHLEKAILWMCEE